LSVAGVTDIPEFVHTQSLGWMAGASNRLTRISDEVWQAVRSELTVGLAAGESIDQLQRRIRSSVETVESRARTIARTEVIGAVNAGSYFEAKGLGVETKSWLATEDKRTRPTHSDADGQQVGMDEMFVVGGALLRFPHDPMGPSGETVNCRCTTLYDDNDYCACTPGWAESETGEQLVAAASSSCGCSGDAATGDAATAAGSPTMDADPETFAEDAIHTGAMVALVPVDPQVLALEDGEPVEELHLTLFYLGEAADIPPELQIAMLAEIGSRAANNWAGPIEATGFGAAIWNPTSDDPSLVLNVGDSDLRSIRDDVQQGIINAPDNADGGRPDWTMVDQHEPWVPHVCLAYDDPANLVAKMPAALERVGPIEFDRVRVAFANETHDFKLGGS
jgi:SPP1 gp7 family putative phage head morphogenesis protein